MWVFFTNIGYFLFALSSLVDRFLLLGPLPRSSLYALYVALFGLFVLLLSPFGFSAISFWLVLLSLLTGTLSIMALWAWYEAILRLEISRVVPIGGALQPIFVLAFNFLIFGRQAFFPWVAGVSYILFIIGSFFLARDETSWRARQGESFILIFVASVLFALTFVLTKYIFIQTSFINGLIWTRLGGLFAIPFLAFYGRAVDSLAQSKKAIQKLSRGAIFIVGAVQLTSALGGGIVLYAVSLASVHQIPLINAMLGTEFIFLYFLAYLLHQKYPQLLKEKMSGFILHQKIFAVSLIIIGLVLLTLS